MTDTINKAGKFYVYTKNNGQQVRLSTINDAMRWACIHTKLKFSIIEFV